jgi:hypothetical protein
MSTFASTAPKSTGLLRRAVQADAVVSATSTVALLFAAAPLADITGIPLLVLQAVGWAVFLPFSAALIYSLSRPTIDRRMAWAFIALNFGWVAISGLALIFGWLPLTPTGFWIVLIQAIVVDLLGVGQFLAVRRMR